MAVIKINYNEGEEPLNYESVELSWEGQDKIFNSGNFIKDWYYMRKFIFNNTEEEPIIGYSSSIDHFISDGAPYDSAYLHFVDGKPILKYFDRSDPNWCFTQRDIDENGIEFFVPENTQPTWEELKEMCEKS
jgi:hypothetical protein